jgi:DsbC/DsbD-like thiol-disulfide interchange protein
VLLRLARATGESRHAVLARGTVDAFLGDLEKSPRGLETLAAAAGQLVGKPDALLRSEATPPSRMAIGPVSLEATLSSPQVVAGGRFEALVHIALSSGFSINAHTPGKYLVGLSVSVPGEEFAHAPPHYPEPTEIERSSGPAAGHAGSLTVAVPLSVRANHAAGSASLRLRVGFQACDFRSCQAPESALLEVPLRVVARVP